MTAYEWGDPKNPEYVEYILDQVDQRRKDRYLLEREEYYLSGMTANQPKDDNV